MGRREAAAAAPGELRCSHAPLPPSVGVMQPRGCGRGCVGPLRGRRGKDAGRWSQARLMAFDDALWFRALLHASCFASRMRSIYAWCCIVTPTRQQPRRRFLWCSGGCERLLALPCVHWCTRCPAGLCATAAPGAVLALAAQRSCIVPTPLPELPDATVTVSMQYAVAVSPQLSSPRMACIPRASLDFHVMDAKTSAIKIAENVEVALPAAWQSQLMPDAEVRAVCTNKVSGDLGTPYD